MEIELIKSDRISILPITNKNKLCILMTYIHNVKNEKNNISTLAIKDKHFQDLLFVKDISLNKYYTTFNNEVNYLTGWEFQKFFNQDLLDKELNRIEQWLFSKTPTSSYKGKIYQLIKSMIRIKAYEFTHNLKSFQKELIHTQQLMSQINVRYHSRIEQLFQNIFNRYKYHRKPIHYRSGSIIKCNQKDLGNTTPRIIKDHTNTKYQYYYCLDIIEFNNDNNTYVKSKINLPLAYNNKYHQQDLKQYIKRLNTNKFNIKKNKMVYEDNQYKYVIKDLNLKKINKNYMPLFTKEHQISLSHNTNRLTISLPKIVKTKLETHPITSTNTIGIDIGGNINNTLVDSNNNITCFDHLEKILNKLDVIDKLSHQPQLKKKPLAKIYRVNEYYINNIIANMLKTYKTQGIKHLVFEHLNTWNLNGHNRELKQKSNRIFRLLRHQGIVNLFKKQAYKHDIYVHTVPSYYTSQRCSCCGKVDKNNLSDNRIYECECGNKMDRDENAAKNIKYYLERFSRDFCSYDNVLCNYNSLKYITKEVVRKTITNNNSK